MSIAQGSPGRPPSRLPSRLPGRLLAGATLLMFAFIMAPIVSIVVFSFNADRFPSLPWGGFSLKWYEAVLSDYMVRAGFLRSLKVSAIVAVLATTIGFCTAYLDYRFRFTGKLPFLILACLPPTVPVLILGLSMLSFFSMIDLVGRIEGVIVGHVVLCSPFAMALIRMRMADLDPDIEPAAWNLGASRLGTIRQVVLPFCAPAILAALSITAAVSFDEFMIAWFVSGLEETLPVRILALLQGQVSPRINAIGSMVFAISITLVVISQALALRRRGREA